MAEETSSRNGEESTTMRRFAHTNPMIQEADDNFFENFTALQWKLENRRLQLLRSPDDEDSAHGRSKSPRRHKQHIKFGQLTHLDSIDIDLLYVEALYTIRHKIGRSDSRSAADVSGLYEYVQNAFNVTTEAHGKLFSRATEEKPPVVILNVILLEGRNLVAKDPNGFSDPYCMLGIIPGSGPTDDGKHRQSLVDLQDVGGPEEKETLGLNRCGKNKSLGGSFRRKKKFHAGDIPAKYIKASSVQRETLNPTWNEKFKFDLDNPETDKFHMDIWDHDDEESVVEAAKKLNEVSSMKGLGRYFKQVAQSARASGDESIDDFLGTITLSLNDLPSTVIDKWYTLEGRPGVTKASERGEVHLKLWLGTREDRPGIADEDKWSEVAQHEALVRIFAEYELRHFGKDTLKWQGNLPQPALTILHQHARQGDLTPVQEALCYWLAYCKVHLGVGLDYNLLHTVLEKLEKVYSTTELSREEEEAVTDCFVEFLKHCYSQLQQHREEYPAVSKHGIKRLEDMLKCLALIHRMDLFHKCLPFQRDLKAELSHIIKKGAITLYERGKSSYLDHSLNEVEMLSELSILTSKLNSACNDAHYVYHPIFYKITDVNYFPICYKEWERLLLEEELITYMSEKLSCDLVSCVHSSVSEQQKRLLQIFELYFALSEFIDYRLKMDAKDQVKVPISGLETWFESSLNSWLSLAKEKCTQRIDLAIQMDKPIPATKESEIKHSSSHIDVCYCLQQIAEFWNHVSLPDLNRKAEYLHRVVQDLCTASSYYIDRLFANLAHAGFYDDTVQFSPVMVENLCINVNNAEHVRRVMKDAPDMLRLSTLLHHLEKSSHNSDIKHKWKTEFAAPIGQIEELVANQVEAAMNRLCDKLRDQLKKHVFHFAYAGASCPVEQATKPLIDCLDKQLVDYHKWLLKENFARLLEAKARSVFAEIKEKINENPGAELSFFNKLGDGLEILLDFFNADGKGVPMDQLKQEPIYNEVVKLLQLNRLSTFDLIETYYLSMLREQEEITDQKYGVLNVRAYYNEKLGRLVLDIVNAKDIIPLDANGLSDPFVIVEIVPGMCYPQCKVTKTKTVYKTLNPTFNESLEFIFAKDKLPKSAAVHLIAMDFDWMSTNDFAGEAYIPLRDVPGISTTSVGAANVKNFCLTLMHSKVREPPSPLSVLQLRKDDKDAQDFVKHVDAVRRT